MPVPGGAPAVVVIQCSDPRYQVHCHDFVRNGLEISRYSLLAVPGGIQTLTLVDYLPKFGWAGWRWMKFLANLARPERIILIAHDDCRWYVENGFAATPDDARVRQVADMRRGRASLIDRFGPVRVDLFYATLDGERAVFRGVEASPQP